jgi:putative spermidine/putrescine transport system ATP-binding protein
MTIALSIRDVHVTLGHNPVLEGVSLDAAPGEFVTLLGASGSGKSTLLNVVAGLQRVDSGQVLFDGASVEKRPPRRRNVGVVFQSYALFPHMTVVDNIAFPLRAARVPPKKRRAIAAEMLELVQLGAMADRKPESLSGGQRQRVAVARALASDPGILLLDEPMAALDKQLREQMQVEIKRIQQKVGITTLSVTHDQSEAMTMSDRVAIMHEGRFVQCASPEELYRHPVDEYVASFLGEANLVPAHGDDGHAPVVTGTAVVRPEDLTLIGGDIPAGRWVFEGPIQLLSFQGSRYRLELLTNDGQRIVCSLSPHTDVGGMAPGAVARVACLDPGLVHIIDHRRDPAALEPVA